MKRKHFFIILLILYLQASVLLQASPQVFTISIQKCGTHLLSKLISLLINKKGRFNFSRPAAIKDEILDIDQNNSFLMSHCFFSSEDAAFITQKNMRGIFMHRDPRDRVISLIFYVLKDPGSSPVLYELFKNKTMNEMIYECIDRIPAAYGSRLAWMDYPCIYTTSFEKLVGSSGGGSDEAQRGEIRNIAHHIGIELDDVRIKNIAQQLYGGTDTFREGKIGSWKQYFTEEHKNYFKAKANQLLIDLGYEKDDRW